MLVTKRDGSKEPINESKINARIQQACDGLSSVDWSEIALSASVNWYDGITTDELDKAIEMSAASMIQYHPNYSKVAARILLYRLYDNITYANSPFGFDLYLTKGMNEGRLDKNIRPKGAVFYPNNSRDGLFDYLGLKTLVDRYLIRDREGNIIELPQWLFMRVALGISLTEKEEDRVSKTSEFYEVMSTFKFMPSTPTLFSAGTVHPQLSSCFLNTVEDSIEGIFKTYTDNAKLSKWAGGVGTDWTNVRGTGSLIKGTNGDSQGVIPWLKIDNDVAIAVNQGGKRKGAHCAYLETWHIDIYDFLEAKKNVGDERRRLHDINTANWIPDLFMRRVEANSKWTLFSPSDVPELHDLFGESFEEAYEKREAQFDAGEIPGRLVEAKDLWKKMLSMLFETGHPWITFKDACNYRNPQQHCGVIHNSNLCTEITLNNSATETAVCNLGSIVLTTHLKEGIDPFDWKIDYPALAETVKTAVRMLDNVIDVNFYPTPEAKEANQKHRPIGLGLMGYQDVLFAMGVHFESDDNVRVSENISKMIFSAALIASEDLAVERGAYSSYEGSLWSKGITPAMTHEMHVQDSKYIERYRHHRDIGPLRNSNLIAIAPTATIANICGVSPSIEPLFSNLFVTSNMSGEFVMINKWLVSDLETLGLWSRDMAERIKANDGDVSNIEEIPKDTREKYPTVFDIDQYWLIEAAAARGKWIDQAQSLNLYVKYVSGKALNDMYFHAWRAGLKTTYYLRTRAASQVEKSTVDQEKFGKTHLRTTKTEVCDPNKVDCEACQ